MTYSQIDRYTSFYLEKDQAAVCGAAASNGINKRRIVFKLRPAGDYLDGLLEILNGRGTISVHKVRRRGAPT